MALSEYRHPYMEGSGKKTMGHGLLIVRSLIFWKIILRYCKAFGIGHLSLIPERPVL